MHNAPIKVLYCSINQTPQQSLLLKTSSWCMHILLPMQRITLTFNSTRLTYSYGYTLHRWNATGIKLRLMTTDLCLWLSAKNYVHLLTLLSSTSSLPPFSSNCLNVLASSYYDSTKQINKISMLGHWCKWLLECVHLHKSVHASADMQLVPVNYEYDQCHFLFVWFK